MKYCTIFLIGTMFAMSGCHGGRGTSMCATPLIYETNPYTLGQQAVTNTSVYYATLFLGANNSYIEAKLDTGSADLVIGEDNFRVGSYSRLGQVPFAFKHQANESIAFNAIDKVQV